MNDETRQPETEQAELTAQEAAARGEVLRALGAETTAARAAALRPALDARMEEMLAAVARGELVEGDEAEEPDESEVIGRVDRRGGMRRVLAYASAAAVIALAGIMLRPVVTRPSGGLDGGEGLKMAGGLQRVEAPAESFAPIGTPNVNVGLSAEQMAALKPEVEVKEAAATVDLAMLEAALPMIAGDDATARARALAELPLDDARWDAGNVASVTGSRADGARTRANSGLPAAMPITGSAAHVADVQASAEASAPVLDILAAHRLALLLRGHAQNGGAPSHFAAVEALARRAVARPTDAAGLMEDDLRRGVKDGTASVLVASVEEVATPASALAPTTGALTFVAYDVFVNAEARALASYQLEVVPPMGARLVGVEGGEAGVFAAAPYYDTGALASERIVLAGLALAPARGTQKVISEVGATGRVRVARVHVALAGATSEGCVATMTAAGDARAVRMAPLPVVDVVPAAAR